MRCFAPASARGTATRSSGAPQAVSAAIAASMAIDRVLSMASPSCEQGIWIAFDGPRQRRYRLCRALHFAQRIARVAAKAIIGLITLDGCPSLRQHLTRLFDQTGQIAAGISHGIGR